MDVNKKEYKYPEYVRELGRRGSVLGLESMRVLLDVLGHPERDLSIIHIAGTNGKGSTIAFLSSILNEAGYTVGRYISPTIQCYEERFQIDGNMISPNDLEIYYEEIMQAIQLLEKKSLPLPTLFEVETAISFLYFKKEKVDYVLLEVGMGGAMDATNVIEDPVMSIITSISYDHMAFLGDSLRAIAGEKAGIIKKGHPVTVAPNPEEVQMVMRERALENGSPYKLLSCNEYEIADSDYQKTRFIWKGNVYQIFLPGDHQVANAVTALEVAERLPGIKEEHLKIGLEKTRWPGRLQVISTNPVIIRDGAHNPDAAGKLADYLQKHFTNRKIIYIMGVLRDKEYDKMLSLLLPLGSRLYTFKPTNPRGLEAEELTKAALSCMPGYAVTTCEGVREAFAKALEQNEDGDVFMICGSLSFMEEMKDLI